MSVIDKFFKKYPPAEGVIAAGVSGGADSLALVWQLRQWTQKKGRKIVALTVDHGLRPEAKAEAQYVSRLMKEWGVEHHILVWEGEKPKRDIEAAAREARYRLLADWCLARGIRLLAVGHHLQDQAETFLLRLVRGSGLYGLSGMLPVSSRLGLTIIRPQLEQKPEDLRRLLAENNITWKEDASNQDDYFERVKVRQSLPELEKLIGLTRERLAETTAVLARSRCLIEELTDQEIAKEVQDWFGVARSIRLKRLAALHAELQYRVLARLIKEVGGRDYPPESDEMLRLCGRIFGEDFKGCTLGQCELFTSQGRLWIIPELKEKPVLSKEQWAVFAAGFKPLLPRKLPYKLRRTLFLRLAK